MMRKSSYDKTFSVLTGYGESVPILSVPDLAQKLVYRVSLILIRLEYKLEYWASLILIIFYSNICDIKSSFLSRLCSCVS